MGGPLPAPDADTVTPATNRVIAFLGAVSFCWCIWSIRASSPSPGAGKVGQMCLGTLHVAFRTTSVSQPYASVQTPLWGMATTVLLFSVPGFEEPPVPGLFRSVLAQVWP